MTGNEGAGSRILGRLRSADGKGAVRMEDRFDTDIGDLWSAITDPARVARWLGEVAGDFRPGLDPADVLLLMGYLWRTGPGEDGLAQSRRLTQIVLDGLRTGRPGDA